jgi:hypothetical protein
VGGELGVCCVVISPAGRKFVQRCVESMKNHWLFCHGSCAESVSMRGTSSVQSANTPVVMPT